MEFKTAMRILTRMCRAHELCASCPMDDKCNTGDMMECPDTFEYILTNWAEKHPEKTIADDFLEKHPKAPKDEDGIPFACAQRCGYTEGCIGNTSRKYCTQCWRRPLEEAER